MSPVAMDALRAEYRAGRRLVAQDFERLADYDGMWTCCRAGCEGRPVHAAKDCPQACHRAGCPEEAFHYQAECPRMGSR